MLSPIPSKPMRITPDIPPLFAWQCSHLPCLVSDRRPTISSRVPIWCVLKSCPAPPHGHSGRSSTGPEQPRCTAKQTNTIPDQISQHTPNAHMQRRLFRKLTETVPICQDKSLSARHNECGATNLMLCGTQFVVGVFVSSVECKITLCTPKTCVHGLSDHRNIALNHPGGPLNVPTVASVPSGSGSPHRSPQDIQANKHGPK